MELVLKLNPETISFSYQEIAEQSQESLSGVLITSIGSAVKYDLLEVRDGRVYWSLLGGLITKNKDDTNLVIKSFLSPEPYADLYRRFNGQRLQKEVLEKIFIKEYDCEPKFASRAVKYFLEGLRYLHLIDGQLNLRMLDLENLELNDFNRPPLAYLGEKPKHVKKPEVLVYQEDDSSTYAAKPINTPLTPLTAKTQIPPPTSSKPIQSQSKPTSSKTKVNEKSYQVRIQGDGLLFECEVTQDEDWNLLENIIKAFKN